MSNVKNFGLVGIGSEVQLGKGGAKLASETDKIVAKNEAGALTQIQVADPVAAQDVVTKAHLDSKDGMSFVLGTPTDAALNDGAVALTNATTITNAVDQLNEILGKLVPAAPTNFPGGQTLTVTSVGNSPLLASGAVPDNTAGGTLPVSAGSAVTRVTAATASSNVIGDNGTTGFVGPGDSGTVQALVNNTVVDSVALTSGTDNRAGVLTITNDQAYPLATPGFWQSFRASIVGASVTQGWNRLKLNHTGASATNDVYIVRDNITAIPSTTNVVISENAAGTLAYSSGVPHYNTGASLKVSFDTTNIAGETYRSGNIFQISGNNSIFTTKGFAAGTGGLPNPIARQTLNFSAVDLPVAIDATNVHNSGQATVQVLNVNGTGSTGAIGPAILVKNGSAGSRVDELSFPVSIAVNGGVSGNGFRVVMSNGDNPSDDKSSITTTDWSNSAALNAWDASVVGGLLKHDVINYTTGFLPAGPDYSGHNASQYITVAVRRTAVSKFDINVTGTYSGLWVKLVGVSEAYTSTQNGWYSMSTLYGGAGYPGNQGGANGSLGCALGAVASGTGSWTCTFGTLSSTAATNNLILVRFKLTAGQSISALSFIPPTR